MQGHQPHLRTAPCSRHGSHLHGQHGCSATNPHRNRIVVVTAPGGLPACGREVGRAFKGVASNPPAWPAERRSNAASTAISTVALGHVQGPAVAGLAGLRFISFPTQMTGPSRREQAAAPSLTFAVSNRHVIDRDGSTCFRRWRPELRWQHALARVTPAHQPTA